MDKNLLTLTVVSSVITTLSPAVILGIPWLVICVVAFPIVFVGTLVFTYIGSKLFGRYAVQRFKQIFVILPLGFLGGLSIYLLLFSRNIINYGFEGLSLTLLTEYSLMGLYAAVVTWVLYNFGPLKKVPDHSNKHLKSDAAKAAPLK